MFGFLGFLLIIFLLIIFIGFTILGNIPVSYTHLTLPTIA